MTGNAVTAGVGLTLVPPSFSGTSAIGNGTSGFFPFASAVECASVLQSSAGGVVSNTVPGGTVTYSLNNPLTGGFGTNTVFSSVVQILESNGVTTSITCGSANATQPDCQGATTNAAGNVIPNPALVVHVGFIPGATFSFIGAGSPVFTLTDTYREFPALGTLTATASTTINIIPPVYSLTLTANPATVAASPTGGVTSTTTLTATLYHYASYGCVPVSGSTIYVVCANAVNFTTGGVVTPGLGNNPNLPGAILLQAGAEPGNIEFYVANGAGAYFTGLGSNAGSAGSVVTVHCGALANTLPQIVIPTTGILPTFSFNSCTSASVQLVGTTIGVITVVANYTADYTGATAQASTTINVNAAAATVTLTRGCNEVVINAGAGMTAAQVLALASPTANVVSIWQFNNSLHAFQALYFNTAGAPTDISGVGSGSQSVFYCVSGNTTVTTGF